MHAGGVELRVDGVFVLQPRARVSVEGNLGHDVDGRGCKVSPLVVGQLQDTAMGDA